MLQEMLTLTNVKPRTKRNNDLVLDSIVNYTQQGLLPFYCKIAAYGIKYAVVTGRLSTNAKIAVEALSPYQLVKLVVEIAKQEILEAAIPSFLNEKF